MSAAPLAKIADGAPTPLHVAIIMDGNGRWANARGKPRNAGHRAGAEAVRRTIEAAAALGIKYLTLFSFSSENWKRPATEVSDLMGLLRLYLRKEVTTMVDKNVRLKVIGERGRLSADIISAIDEAEARTAHCSGLTLVLALNYGGRAEIVQASKALAKAVAAGDFDPDAIDETMFAGALETAGMPDPDLLIRTSGEQRISNFLLWQLAYAEFVFVDKHWPDFGSDDLAAAIKEFGNRERRFGSSSA
jgi:undecaprenyl diphosphate synthase